ncbi:MAG: hypothetical protein OHK0021_02940 [Bryobacter sp.]
MPEKRPKAPPSPGFFYWISRAVLVCAIILSLGAVFFVKVQAEGFLKSDPRFFLERSPDYSEAPPNLVLEGVVNADREAILALFEPDLGRSVLWMNLDQRRVSLLSIPWVADATVSRLWPNRIHVRIAERQPVAFVKLASHSHPTLVDAEGYLMPAPAKQVFHLPVVAGVSPEIGDEVRKERMARVVRLIREFGANLSLVSEIDVHDIRNLQVTGQFRKRVITLKLGDREFGLRFTNFINNVDSLLESAPVAAVFDMRYETSVVAEPDPTLAAPPASASDPATAQAAPSKSAKPSERRKKHVR